ncbi:UNVERIFIED_ORG: hypothetical protein J2791_004696 [Burkholderia contaminans]|nr:hypothetical protein [Burkholderia contaminans]
MRGGDSLAVCCRVEVAATGQFMLKTKNKVLVYLAWRDGLLTFTQSTIGLIKFSYHFDQRLSKFCPET